MEVLGVFVQRASICIARCLRAVLATAAIWRIGRNCAFFLLQAVEILVGDFHHLVARGALLRRKHASERGVDPGEEFRLQLVDEARPEQGLRSRDFLARQDHFDFIDESVRHFQAHGEHAGHIQLSELAEECHLTLRRIRKGNAIRAHFRRRAPEAIADREHLVVLGVLHVRRERCACGIA